MLKEEQLFPDDRSKPGSNNWLQRLKDESWEAELLVSAIATFGTFQLFDVVFWAINRFIDILPVAQHLIGYGIIFPGLMAVSILVSMFIIHFFLRAFWVGLVGLNSVFPEYGLEDSAYSKTYTEKILSILPKQQETIQKVDELCSVIFSAAFCLLMIYAYLALTLSLYLFLFNFLSTYIPRKVLLIPIGLIFLLFLVQSILSIVGNLKPFKKNVAMQTWMFKIVRLGSIIMYGPLYKILLQITMTFGSNFKKKKSMIGLLLSFLFCGIVVSGFMAAKSNLFHLIKPNPFYSDTMYQEYYGNQNRQSDFLLAPEITSDIIDTKVMKLFIPIYKNERKQQEQFCGSFEGNDRLNREERKLQIREKYLDCYRKYHRLFLNGEKIQVDFMKQDHPVTGQFGLLCYVKIDHLPIGKNILKVKKQFEKEVVSEWSIPFYFTGVAEAPGM